MSDNSTQALAEDDWAAAMAEQATVAPTAEPAADLFPDLSGEKLWPLNPVLAFSGAGLATKIPMLHRLPAAKPIAALRPLLRARAAGFAVWLTVIVGLAGRGGSAAHAAGTADVLNRVQPEYLSTLVLTLHDSGRRFLQSWPDWQALSQQGLFREMERFLGALELQRTVFRSDHASNWLVLKGTLGADKARLLAQVRAAIAQPESAPLRPAWLRGL